MLQRIGFTFVSVLVMLALLPTAGTAATDRDSDHRIFKSAASRVLSYSRFTIFDDVRASVDAGVVTLTGKVTMPYKRTDIEARIAGIDGVRKVVNRIEVLPVSTFDEELRYRTARAIYGNPSFWHYAAMANPPIHIVVDRGRVTLTGVVNDEVEKMLARSLATALGALSVESELKTEAEVQAAIGTLGKSTEGVRGFSAVVSRL
jgi:hyperosmotically inducible protein